MRDLRKFLKWIILIAVPTGVLVLFLKDRQNKKQKDQIFIAGCINKEAFLVPDIQFININAANNGNIPVVIIKRNRKVFKNILNLKMINRHGAISWQLNAAAPAVTILKADTIVITINDRQYLIYGFESNAYPIDHQILDCDEIYQLNGIPYRSKELNRIDVSTKYTGLKLSALSPYRYSFQDPASHSQAAVDRADFFYVSSAVPRPRELYDAVLEQKRKITGNYQAFSIYVYNKTNKLNSAYKGNFQNIKGVYDNDLLCYSRWMNGKLDIFYIINGGNVIYDMVENKEVSPPFEFN